MVFPENDYDASALTESNGAFVFNHKAVGADRFRYTWNYGKNWTDWASYEETTTIEENLFYDKENVWKGAHIIMQCKTLFSLY